MAAAVAAVLVLEVVAAADSANGVEMFLEVVRLLSAVVVVVRGESGVLCGAELLTRSARRGVRNVALISVAAAEQAHGDAADTGAAGVALRVVVEVVAGAAGATVSVGRSNDRCWRPINRNPALKNNQTNSRSSLSARHLTKENGAVLSPSWWWRSWKEHWPVVRCSLRLQRGAALGGDNRMCLRLLAPLTWFGER